MSSIFVFELGRLAYRGFEDSDHWHLGITGFSDESPSYDKILDLTWIRLGCFYWRRAE